MGMLLQPADLTPFATIPQAKAEAMITDAEAIAYTVAPCLDDVGFSRVAAAKAVLRGAVLRWNEAGTGAVQQVSSGPFGMTTDNRHTRKAMFLPSEITELQALCREHRGRMREHDLMPPREEWLSW